MKHQRSETSSTRVAIIHTSFNSKSRWIDDFVVDRPDYIFQKVYPPRGIEKSWHNRGRVTPIGEWLNHFRYALRAARSGADVVVTNFPQLAIALCFWKMLLNKKFFVIGWSFNIGSTSNRLKGRMAGWILRWADFLVVHARTELKNYSDWLNLPLKNFVFYPLQHHHIHNARLNSGAETYIVSLGSAGRDYKTLFAALAGRDEHAVVIAKSDAVKGLEVPQNVELRNGISLSECYEIATGASFGVVPISNNDTASGQVSFLMLMALGVPQIVTDCVGTQDYLQDGYNALIVPLGDIDALSSAITRLGKDAHLRDRLAKNGFETWREQFSDEAAGRNLVRVLDIATGKNCTAPPF